MSNALNGSNRERELADSRAAWERKRNALAIALRYLPTATIMTDEDNRPIWSIEVEFTSDHYSEYVELTSAQLREMASALEQLGPRP
jgi:hypothetical protein